MKVQTTLKDQLQVIKPQFVELVDKPTFDKEVSFALQHINKNKQLQKATTTSKIQSVLNIAQVGLSLNPVLKLAYLVPRSENVNGQWVVTCCLEPSYQGLCKLATDTGSVKSLTANIVYDGDFFELEQGTDVKVVHKPNYMVPSTDKKLMLIYTVATLSDNSKLVEVMTKEQIDEIMEMSESFKAFKAGKIKSCVWTSHYEEMARKTVIRRALKYVPKTDMWDKLGEAISLDEQDYKASDSQIDYIDSLIMTAAISPDELEDIEREKSYINGTRAEELIKYLKENQIDPIAAGLNYSQTDIKNKINTEI